MLSNNIDKGKLDSIEKPSSKSKSTSVLIVCGVIILLFFIYYLSRNTSNMTDDAYIYLANASGGNPDRLVELAKMNGYSKADLVKKSKQLQGNYGRNKW